jgi:hypothetical protein
MELISTYEDESNEYFLTEYIRGIELFDAIRDIGKDFWMPDSYLFYRST